MISEEIITGLKLTGVVILFYPIITIILYCIIIYCSFLPIFIGILCFIFFAKILEMIPHIFCIIKKNCLSDKINNSTFLFVLYGTSMAGIFEEVGRFICFKYLLSDFHNAQTSISFGLGHGGIENITVVAVTFFQLAGLANKMNKGEIEDYHKQLEGKEMALKQLEQMEKKIKEMKYWEFPLVTVERLLASIGQVCFSIIVYKGVAENDYKYLIIAIVGHALFDVGAGLYQRGAISIISAELSLVILTPFLAIYSCYLYSTIDFERLD